MIRFMSYFSEYYYNLCAECLSISLKNKLNILYYFNKLLISAGVLFDSLNPVLNPVAPVTIRLFKPDPFRLTPVCCRRSQHRKKNCDQKSS